MWVYEILRVRKQNVLSSTIFHIASLRMLSGTDMDTQNQHYFASIVVAVEHL